MPIVYDGTRGSSPGDLFKGLKLFISFRVPQRERWVNLVQGNGGEVVRLEKHADMLIADHIKRKGTSPPPGSYSWQWIEYSVKNGSQQDKDDYRIEGVPAAGASAPAKGKQRVKFTQEDDEILAKFVLNHEKEGNPTKGNVIFVQLYKQYPHHSAQSWRDRWVKYVSSRPRPNLPQDDPRPDGGLRISPGQDPGSVGHPSQSRAGEPNVYSTTGRSPASTPKHQALSQGRNKFTKEDDEILLRMIREKREIAGAKGGPVKDLDGNKVFQELEAKYPHHPWSSWRNRWVRNLKDGATVEQDDSGMQEEGEERPEDLPEQPKQQSRASRDVPEPRPQAKSAMALSSAAVSSPAQSRAQQPQPKSDDERLKRKEQIKRRARAAKLLQRTWRGHVVRRDVRRDRAQLEASVVPLQSLMRGYLLRMWTAERLLTALEANTEPLEDEQNAKAKQYEDAQEDLDSEVDGNDSNLKDQFYEDLQDFLDVSGTKIERRPIVDGREIELWDLFLIATQQDCAAEDRDWEKVAQRLGFDWADSAGYAKDLKKCYDRNLAEFEEAIACDDQDDAAGGEDERYSNVDDEQGLPQTSDAVTAPKEPFPAPSSPPYQSSSPVAGVKRSFQQSTDPQSELSYPSDRSSKRRRRDRGRAIPQTPEHELGFAGRSSSRAAAHEFSSPLKSRGAAADDFLNNGIHDIEEIDDLPDLVPPRTQRFIEPETQDFGVVMSGNDTVRQSIEEFRTGYMTDEDDNSPSQQLLSELDAFSSSAPPVPFRGNGATSTNRPPFVEPRPSPQGTPAKAAQNNTSTLKATKRLLPQQYQTRPAISAAARLPASAPMRNGIAAAPLRSTTSISAKPIASAHRPDVDIQNSRQVLSASPTRAVQPSAPPPKSSRKATASSAPVPNPPRHQDRAQTPDFNEEYIDAQFDHFTALGYDPRHIGQAMEATSLQRGPMTVALQSLESGKGLPQNEDGIWTDDDDEKLRKVRDYARREKSGAVSSGSGENTREKAQVEQYRKFLLNKHETFFAARMAFMNMMDKGPGA